MYTINITITINKNNNSMTMSFKGQEFDRRV